MSIDRGVKVLVQVIQDLSAARSLNEVTSLVRRAARAIAEADGATFVLREGDLCSYVDEDAIAPLWKGQKFPLTACVSGWAMLNKKSVVIEDIYKDDRVPIDAYRPTFVKSLAMTPIRIQQPIGAIGTYWKEIHRPTEEQQELLQALANSVSVAMENLNLYSNLKNHVAKLEQANQSKDEFLMNVSHELRTPLNSILGWSEILSQGVSSSEELEEGLLTIQRNAVHQLRIVEDLMDSSRILVGRIHLEKVPIDMVQIVDQALVSLKTALQKKNLILEFKNDLVSATIKADVVRLRQIIDNILTNAVKFSYPGGKVQVSLQKAGPQVQLRVQDEGEGISPEFIPHVFDRLSQANASSTRKYGGLGLGLSIAKHLTGEFDGSLTAESAGPGKGATFTLAFPMQAFETKSEQPIASANAEKQILKDMPILVIDDDFDCRTIVERVLKKYGANVQSVDSVSAALKVNDPKNFKVIVCDLSMPEEDGFSLAHKIREGRTRFGTDVPMMALTAFTDSANREKAIHEGFDDFMGKPFRVPELINSVVHLRESVH